MRKSTYQLQDCGQEVRRGSRVSGGILFHAVLKRSERPAQAAPRRHQIDTRCKGRMGGTEDSVTVCKNPAELGLNPSSIAQVFSTADFPGPPPHHPPHILPPKPITSPLIITGSRPVPLVITLSCKTCANVSTNFLAHKTQMTVWFWRRLHRRLPRCPRSSL